MIKNIGQDAFDKLSYGELEQAYEDEFKRLGFTKVAGSGFGLHRFVKKVSENHELKDQYIRFFER